MELTKKSTQAFTLVELSIVLVIIGLIVGGVVGGQALVSSARVQSVIKDINKYKISVKAFELQYDALPGDFSEAEAYWGSAGDCETSAGTGTQTCNGDGDGIIDYDSGAFADAPYETWRVWEHLQNANILDSNLTGIATDAWDSPGYNVGYEAGVSSPGGAYGGSIFAIFYLHEASWTNGAGRHAIAFGATKAGTHEGRWYNAILTPKDAKNIDTKIDDGNPYLGTVVDIGSTAYTPDCTDTEVAATAKFNLSSSSVECLLMIDLN